MRRLLQGCALVVCSGFASYLMAATSNISVTATVEASCDVTANALAFPDYDPVDGSEQAGQTTLDVKCTNGTDYVVKIGVGGGDSATVADRRMEDASDNQLHYSLYQDASRLTVWGETEDVDTVTGEGSGGNQEIPVFAKIFSDAQQNSPPAGLYSDTVLVTVEPVVS